MFGALYDFFWSLFTDYSSEHDWAYLENFTKDSFFGVSNYQLNDYFALLCSLISMVFIIVLCCLFVYKIIKLIGGLIR